MRDKLLAEMEVNGNAQARLLVHDGDGRLNGPATSKLRAGLRLWLEHKLQAPVSMLSLGETAIFEVVV